jgi:hypothetical protein
MMEGQFVDGFLMEMKVISVERGAIHDRDPMLENLRCCIRGSLCWHTDEGSVDVSRLTDVGEDRNVSQCFRELASCRRRSPYECRDAEVMIQADSLRAGLSHPTEPYDRKTQGFP